MQIAHWPVSFGGGRRGTLEMVPAGSSSRLFEYDYYMFLARAIVDQLPVRRCDNHPRCAEIVLNVASLGGGRPREYCSARCRKQARYNNLTEQAREKRRIDERANRGLKAQRRARTRSRGNSF